MISERTKRIASAIVHIFETSKPFGEYDALVVLDDGAGVSYGINQFTHRSGSLYAVVTAYLAKGGQAGRGVLQDLMPVLLNKSVQAITTLAGSRRFKAALREAAATPEMRAAQHEIAFGKYASKAIAACEGSNFRLPLSFAVIYDSINHGSYERIRDRVSVKRLQFASDLAFEKDWITEYVRKRDEWLESVPRLRKTDYRTDFFLAQIARNNWSLDLPMNVHGYRLTETDFADASSTAQDLTAEKTGESPSVNSADNLPETSESIPPSPSREVPPADPQPSNYDFSFAGYAGKAETAVNTAAEKFDRVNGVAGAIANRKDAAKSLWTTVTGSIGQGLWAVLAFFLGLPREVWIVVACIAGALMLLYLYRQISLGKIREKTKAALAGVADMI